MTCSFLHPLLTVIALLSSLSHINFSAVSAAAFFNPKALLLPVSQDIVTHQYVVKLSQRTPPTYIPLTLALGSPLPWLDCNKNYISSTYQPAKCNSPQCALVNAKTCGSCKPSPKPGCNINTCKTTIYNPVTSIYAFFLGELASDVVHINATDGSNPGPVVTAPNILFGCGSNFLLQGLANGVQGIAALGRTKTSLPSQFSSNFHFPNKFALCLSPSLLGNGIVFFGDGPYDIPSVQDASASLTYTPLLSNPASPSEYFIGVTSIKIGETQVPINKALLSIDSEGNGGTKISTIQPYTTLESSIYNAVTSSFDNQVRSNHPRAKRVESVAPFGVCYDVNSMDYTRLGVVVPDITLVLQSEKVVWTFYTTNSMVAMSNGTTTSTCLGFVDGGKNPKTSIVIGGYQVEDNLLQFDIDKGRLGFQYLVLSMSRCSNFNFTSNA